MPCAVGIEKPMGGGRVSRRRNASNFDCCRATGLACGRGAEGGDSRCGERLPLSSSSPPLAPVDSTMWLIDAMRFTGCGVTGGTGAGAASSVKKNALVLRTMGAGVGGGCNAVASSLEAAASASCDELWSARLRRCNAGTTHNKASALFKPDDTAREAPARLT
jgi:hypothetical protein